MSGFGLLFTRNPGDTVLHWTNTSPHQPVTLRAPWPRAGVKLGEDQLCLLCLYISPAQPLYLLKDHTLPYLLEYHLLITCLLWKFAVLVRFFHSNLMVLWPYIDSPSKRGSK